MLQGAETEAANGREAETPAEAAATLAFMAEAASPPPPAAAKTGEPARKRKKKKGGGDGDEESELDTLKRYIDSAELFRAVGGGRWCSVKERKIRTCIPTTSADLEYYMIRRFVREKDQQLPSKAALETVMRYANATAANKPYIRVFIRVGWHKDKFYLDLSDGEGNVVEIDAEGWRITQDPPVYFARPEKLRPLPMPTEGGNVFRLSEILNADERGIQFSIAFLLGALNPRIPYPILVITGEQGSAKTNYMQTLKSLIDPSETINCALPDDQRNLIISASNEHVLNFDNVSNINGDMSDALCRVATGAGFSHRELHTNGNEFVLHVRKPMILNGITDAVTRPDLLDRALVISTERILPRARKTVEAIEETFEEVHADVLGGLLDLMTRGLRRKAKARAEIDELPRMADFAVWVTAAGDGDRGASEEDDRADGALWPHHDFLEKYEQNRASAMSTITQDDPLTDLLLAVMRDSTGVRMFDKAELHTEMVKAAGDERRQHPFLANKRALSNALKRATPGLETLGIRVTEERSRTARFTKIAITDADLWASIRGAG